ncbi:MAG: Cdc6/Cdc18 family protein [Nanoarchaeota archaeon]
MGIFKDMLGSDQSLFKNTVALDYDYIPKLVPYREKEQKTIASCIKPLFMDANGRNVLLYGPPGVGKTVATKHILKELEEETDDIIPIFINCWQKNSSYKVLVEICEQMDYVLTHNKKTDELFGIVRNIVNKKSAVFVFDEADKLEDLDVLYFILEEIFKKTIILITNHKEVVLGFDDRIKSRLMPQSLEFRQYNEIETRGIMKERLGYAFVPGVWEDDAFEKAVKKTNDISDIRSGLFVLKEAGHAAEDASSTKITVDHVATAIKKLDEFTIKKKDQLEDESRFILTIVKKNPDTRIGELYRIYQQEGGKAVYKTFQRKINKLADNRFVNVKKSGGGSEGNTTIVTFSGNKTLDEFGGQ